MHTQRDDDSNINPQATLWEEAWAALRGAAESYCEDQDGEVAAAFVVNLQTIYEGAKGAELQVGVRASFV